MEQPEKTVADAPEAEGLARRLDKPVSSQFIRCHRGTPDRSRR